MVILFFVIELVFSFQIIIGSRAVVRNNTGISHIPFTHFPPMETSSETTVQHYRILTQNPRILFRFLQFTLYFCGWACGHIEFYTILSHVYICVSTTIVKIQNISIATNIPDIALSLKRIHLIILPSQIPEKHQFVLNFYNCVILRLLCKQNHSVCNIWGLVFFTQNNSLKIDPSCYIYQQFVHLYCRVLCCDTNVA